MISVLASLSHSYSAPLPPPPPFCILTHTNTLFKWPIIIVTFPEEGISTARSERERERERVGLLLLQLFPNGGAMDIAFVALFCIAVGTATAVVLWSLRNAGRTLP